MATDVSAPLPDLTLEKQAILEVDLGDASAVIERIVIHVRQDVAEEAQKIAPFQPLFVYTDEAPGLTR